MMASSPSPCPLPPGEGLLATKVSSLREVQSAGGEELSALMPSMLDRAFEGEL
jgi:hypothetical protein